MYHILTCGVKQDYDKIALYEESLNRSAVFRNTSTGIKLQPFGDVVTGTVLLQVRLVSVNLLGIWNKLVCKVNIC